MAASRLETDLTQGSVSRMLLRFMVPIFLANLLQTLYTMVDTVVVGRYIGSVGISAVTVGSQLAGIFNCIGMGFANGGQVVISQLMGTHDRNGLRQTIGTLLSLSVLIGVGVGVIGILGARPLLGAMNTPEEAWQQVLISLIRRQNHEKKYQDNSLEYSNCFSSCGSYFR